MQRVRMSVALVGGVILAATAFPAVASAHGPTCADVGVLGIEVHGHHVVRDYVVGGALEWPPAGQVGAVVGGRGAALPGGPGPGFHFPNGFAPGASFCNAQSHSPGFHVPG